MSTSIFLPTNLLKLGNIRVELCWVTESSILRFYAAKYKQCSWPTTLKKGWGSKRQNLRQISVLLRLGDEDGVVSRDRTHSLAHAVRLWLSEPPDMIWQLSHRQTCLGAQRRTLGTCMCPGEVFCLFRNIPPSSSPSLQRGTEIVSDSDSLRSPSFLKY